MQHRQLYRYPACKHPHATPINNTLHPCTTVTAPCHLLLAAGAQASQLVALLLLALARRLLLALLDLEQARAQPVIKLLHTLVAPAAQHRRAQSIRMLRKAARLHQQP